MSKRLLTSSEIEDLLSVIPLKKSIPCATALSIRTKLQNKLRKKLEKKEIYPKKMLELKHSIEIFYAKTEVQAGENVGVLTAQSIGEQQTQLNLSSFHSAGMAISMVVTGVPRFIELMNATKKPKVISCQLYFNKGIESIQNLRKVINNQLVEITLENLITSFTISNNKKPESWYDIFYKLYPDYHACVVRDEEDYCISCLLDKKKLYDYNIPLKLISDKIQEKYDDIYCIFSPLNKAQIDIYVDTKVIDLPEDRIFFIDQNNCKEVYLEEVVLPNLQKMIICGIEGLQDIFYKKEPEEKEWMVETNHSKQIGSNFAKLLSLSIVDMTRIISNNMWDIYYTLGIEASRQFLIEEFTRVISSDGGYINQRHIILLVDIMTSTGTLTSISRYGVKRNQVGPIAKSAFEESLTNFLLSGVYGEVESTNGVSAAIVCGKIAKIGTGLSELRMNLSKLKNIPEQLPIIEEEIENKRNEDASEEFVEI